MNSVFFIVGVEAQCVQMPPPPSANPRCLTHLLPAHGLGLLGRWWFGRGRFGRGRFGRGLRTRMVRMQSVRWPSTAVAGARVSGGARGVVVLAQVGWRRGPGNGAGGASARAGRQLWSGGCAGVVAAVGGGHWHEAACVSCGDAGGAAALTPSSPCRHTTHVPCQHLANASSSPSASTALVGARLFCSPAHARSRIVMFGPFTCRCNL